MSSQSTLPDARPRRPRGHVDVVTQVPDQVVEDFLVIYREAFAPLEVRSPARQSLTDDEFRHELADPSVLKFVAIDGDGEIVGLSLVASDLATVPWISVPYYEARYPQHLAEGRLFYFGALLVRPERQGGPWAKFLLDHLFGFLAERRAVGAFDCCGFNVDVVGLPDLIERSGHRVARFHLEHLDRQQYFAVVVEGAR
jgi:ribosomal protein S18 acetylase RimI-like enzyme